MVNSYCSRQLLASIPLSGKRDITLATSVHAVSAQLTYGGADGPPHKG
jgi:hypothetical protein